MPIRKRTAKLGTDYVDTFFGRRYIFPIKPGAKFPPLIRNNLADASNDPAQIEAWEAQWPGCNWGLSHAKSGMMVADIDVNQAKGKTGQETYNNLELEYGWPETEMTVTPSGGFHKIYEGWADENHPAHIMALGINGLGKDIDSPNYTLIPGCTFDDGTSYVGNGLPAVRAPEWMYDVIRSSKQRKTRLANADEVVIELDQPANIATAIDFLKNDAEPSIQGQSGDDKLRAAAYYLKDIGISQEMGAQLLNEYFNPRCEPPWDMSDLEAKMVGAYKYANLSKVGGKTAEADFADDDAAEAAKTPVPAGIYSVEQGKYVTKEAESKALAKFQDWAWVISDKRFYDLKDPKGANERNVWDTKSFDSRFNEDLSSKRGSASDLILRKKGAIRKYERIAFKPGRPRALDNGTSLNLYRQTDIIPRPGDISWWNAHLEYLFPEQEYRDHLLNWMGWLIKNVAKKPKHALIIQGEVNGTGKSFIGRVLTRILHSANVAIVPQNALAGRFNSWAGQCKLILIEELRAGDRNAVKEALHDIITEDTISVERKGVDPVKVENCFGVLAFTNDDAALPLDKTDRRYLVIRTDRTKAEAEEKTKEGYFIRLFAKLEDDDAMAAVAYSLINRNFGTYNGQQAAPITAAKKAMHQASMTEIEGWLDEKREQYPLNARLIRVDDIIEAMPASVERKSARPRIVVKKFLTAEMGMVSLGQCTTPKGDRPHLYASKGAANILMGQPRTVAGKLYEDDMKKIKANQPLDVMDDASDEFAVDESSPLD